jgi:hypothetical protein
MCVHSTLRDPLSLYDSSFSDHYSDCLSLGRKTRLSRQQIKYGRHRLAIDSGKFRRQSTQPVGLGLELFWPFTQIVWASDENALVHPQHVHTTKSSPIPQRMTRTQGQHLLFCRKASNETGRLSTLTIPLEKDPRCVSVALLEPEEEASLCEELCEEQCPLFLKGRYIYSLTDVCYMTQIHTLFLS